MGSSYKKCDIFIITCKNNLNLVFNIRPIKGINSNISFGMCALKIEECLRKLHSL